MTVWKYVLRQEFGFEPQPLRLPQGAEIVHVAAQAGEVCVWVLLDEGQKRIQRWFVVSPTGRSLDDELEYLGTAHLLTSVGELVLHVFELQR